MTYGFNLEQGIIRITAELEGPTSRVFPRLALDTGATATLLNVNVLVTAGYDPTHLPKQFEITTGSGVEHVPEVMLSRFKALGLERVNFPVLAHTLPVSAEVDGLLGLDFFRDRALTLDFRTFQITLM